MVNAECHAVLTDPKQRMSILKILCITGWGVGTAPLQSLQQHLAQHDHVMEVLDIFDPHDPEQMQQQLQQVSHYDVLMGWSLGGQLATLLAERYWQHTGIAKALITLATQPCFVAHAAWPDAMPVAEFSHFQQAYHDDAATCIKRFCYLITQLPVYAEMPVQVDPKQQRLQAKSDWLSLQSLLQLPDTPQQQSRLARGLELLAELNLVENWKNYPGRQRHLYAHQDALIKPQVVQQIAELAETSLHIGYVDGSHAFPVFNVTETADHIVAMLGQHPQ